MIVDSISQISTVDKLNDDCIPDFARAPNLTKPDQTKPV